MSSPADFVRYTLENESSWDVYVYVPSEQDKANVANTMAWLRVNPVKFWRSFEFVVPE